MKFVSDFSPFYLNRKAEIESIFSLIVSYVVQINQKEILP